MSDEDPSRWHWRDLPRLGLLVTAYVITARLGLLLAFENQSATAVWPPTGIAIASLLLWGPKMAPGVFVGAYLANLSTTGAVLSSLGIAGGNTLEAFLALVLLRRGSPKLRPFDHPLPYVRFILAASLLAPTAAATIGVLSLSIDGLVSSGTAGSVWLTWWLGDAAGALLVTPLIVLWHDRPFRWPTPARAAEGGLIFAVLTGLSLLVFGNSAVGLLGAYPVGFLFLPPILWVAFRFDARAAATSTAYLSLIAILGTLAGHGPFGQQPPPQAFLLLQAFMAILAATSFGVAIIVDDRRRTAQALRASRDELEQRVDTRTRSLTRALEALRATETELQHVTSSISDYLWSAEIGPDAKLLHRYYSPVVERITGYSPQWYMSHPDRWIEPIHPDDRPRIQAAAARVASGHSTHEAQEYRIVRPDGTVRWIHDKVNVVKDATGRIRLHGVATDVTERRANEDALRRHRQQLADSQRLAHIGSWEWDVPRDELAWSDELYLMFGVEREGFASTYEGFLQFIHPADRTRVDRVVRRALEQKEPFAVDYRILRSDGAVRHIQGRGTITVDAHGGVVRVGGTAQDVTERVQAEEERAAAQERLNELERLKRMNEFKTQFMNTAAHELSTPLTPIRLQLHFLKNQGDQLPPEKRHQTVQILERNLERLTTLVQELLLGAQLQADRLVLESARIDLVPLVLEAVHSFDAAAHDAGLDLSTELPAELWVEADGKRISQVLFNLLSNAIKYTPRGGSVRVFARQEARVVVVGVRDTGVGIPAQDAPRLFQPFTQLHTDVYRKSGTGLGLYISHGLIALHHGRLWCESEGAGKGSTFSFSLPVGRTQASLSAPVAPVVAAAPAKPY